MTNRFTIPPFSAICRAIMSLLAFATLLLTTTGCGSDDTFRINGKINNFGTGNLRVVYFANGAVQSVVAPAIDGKFSMTGRLQRPALARIYTGNGALVGRFAVQPGETIEAEFDITDPTVMKFDGNDDSKRFAKFIAEHATLVKNGDAAGLNAAISRYVTDNPKRLASGVLMADFYHVAGHEAEAAALIDKLSDAVVTATSLHGLLDLTHRLTVPTDSLRLEPFSLYGLADAEIEINPQDKALTLLMFTDNDCRKADSVTALPSALTPLIEKGSLQIVEISCEHDTASWHTDARPSKTATATDSLKNDPWKNVERCWTPAPYAIMGLEDIPVAKVPWFIVADSTRQVLYLGPSATAAKHCFKL